jgi:hypothetical protein
MSSGYEPVLHALAVEPPVARPGDTVRLIFRTRNVGTLSSPPATVTFALPAGLEALEPGEVPLPPVEPGEAAIATIRARVTPPFDDRIDLELQAFLVLSATRLATNVCVLRVRSRAVLDGASSGTFVEPVDAGTVRVRAVVTNEGDGPALGVLVRVPAPAGCRRVDADEAATLDVERLDAGQSATLDFEARIEHAMTEVRADGAEVRFGAETRRPLPVRSSVTLQPAIAPPVLAVRPLRRRAEVSVDLRNDGWAHAHDACVHIALPAGLRLAEESIEIDGVAVVAARARRAMPAAVARLLRQAGTHALVIALLPARSTTRVCFTANHAGDYDGGTLGVRIEEHEAELDYRAAQYRDVRVDALDVPPGVAPGETVTIRARIVNAGEHVERLGVALTRGGLMEAQPAERTLEAGACAVVDLPLSIGAAAGDGLRLPFTAIVSDAFGERARADLAVTVREPVASTNEADDGTDTLAGRIIPTVHAALRAADDAVAGAPLAVQLDVDVEDALERLTIRLPELAAARYIAGSTSVGGFAILDGAVSSPLHGAGLTLRAIPGATRVTVAWSLMVDAAFLESFAIAVELDADGNPCAPEPLTIRVRGAGAFATRPAELPYHVDACALPARAGTLQIAASDEPPVLDEPEPDEPAPQSWPDLSAPVMQSQTPRWDEVARLLHGVRCGGLVPHVLAVRALYPEPPRTADAATAARDGVGHAVRDVFDRLFVKLRIPGFVVGADDLEDGRLRRALLALVDPDRTNARYATIADAPLGAPAVLRALLATIPPPESGTSLDAAVDDYLRALDQMLASYEALPLELFDDALARGRDAALDDARATLMALIDERVARRPVAC